MTKLELELVSVDDVRSAVSLNNLRLSRAETLEDGYDVSKSLCYNFDATTETPNSAPRRNRFHTNRQERSCQLRARYNVSAIDPFLGS